MLRTQDHETEMSVTDGGLAQRGGGTAHINKVTLYVGLG